MSKERYIDRFFDDDNTDKIYLNDNDGKEIEFEQVATIDYDANYYAILCPLSKIEGVEEGEVMVFLIDEENDKLVYVEDEDTAIAVIEVCASAMEEEDEE
ncbi:MAG: DUF1292 domain-containing protein [Clostridia bacterium]|nr:DUF1292 domain-containing protein [Clostridia bacterium]